MTRRLYGAGPLHASLMVVAAAAIGYVGVRWWRIGPGHLAVWLGGSVVGHDLVLFPAYAAADWLLVRALRTRRWLVQYVRVPAVLSLLLLAVWWPLILDNVPARQRQAGLSAGPFLHRWLLVTAAVFVIAASTAGVALLRRRRATRPRAAAVVREGR